MKTAILVLAVIALVVVVAIGIAAGIMVWRMVIDELRERRKGKNETD